ncbi:ATP-binding protein [Lewinella sp. LCG006]|uniref:ATP-binding protein n=1 Tax=Lewinella sp. LCG006 TaxID=3231911 RepID=UPI0034612942
MHSSIFESMEQAQSPLEEFYASLEKATQMSWADLAPNQQSIALSTLGQQLCQALIALGDQRAQVFSSPNEKKTEIQLQDYLFFYCWLPAGKSFLLLWRNTTFEHLHAQLMVLDAEIKTSNWEAWQQDASNNLVDAASELQRLLPELEAEYSGDPKMATKMMDTWKHQALPWPVYREQIGTITTQIRDLAAKQDLLGQNSTALQKIKKIILSDIDAGLTEIDQLKTIAKEANAYIEENASDARSRIPAYLENQEAQISQQKLGKRFNLALEKGLEALAGETVVPVAVVGAALQVKEINFRRYISRWLDSETLPLLYEVWELTTNIRNNLKMALINIRNRTILLNNENNESPDKGLIGENLCQPLQSFLLQTTDREKELHKLHELIRSRLDEHFRLSKVFQQSNFFLEVPLQSTINQFRNNQNQLLLNLNRWWNTQRQRVRRWLSSVQAEDALSLSEKVVRYIEHHVPPSNNQAYTSIFLTKGYIGESFWVGRKSELQRLATLIKHWRKGYRGSVLLRGDRFTGKSLFGDLVSNRYFPNETIRLIPNAVLHLHNRTFETSFDLGAALDFISKYRFDQPPLIWLDDLELWHDPSCTIHQNTRALLRHMDHHANSIFYMVAAGNPLCNYLESNHQLNKHFQAILPLDSMSQEEVQQAILIRHGATHKELVTKEGQALDPSAFEQAVSRVYRASGGNIGEALNLWAYQTQRRNEEQVYQTKTNFFQLPNFIESDQAILLRTLLLEKRTTEYRLRKRFGPAFSPRYAEALLRLQGLGLLTRHLDGWLELNEAAANSVIRQLKNKQYL